MRSPGKKAQAGTGKRSAYDKALGLLARREHSRRELKTKLSQSGYVDDEASAALARLQDQHYQDDERFADALIRSRITQGYGPLRLQAELKSHGLPERRIRELLQSIEVDWTEQARGQLRRRYGGNRAVEAAERARRAQFLLRRGFAAATVRSVTHADVDDTTDDEG